jgi:hypothetical protein
MKLSIVAAVLSVACSSSAIAATLYDNFNLKQWTVLREGTGPAVHEANQRLEIILPTASSGDRFRGAYSAKCRLQGNFDIQVRYTLLNFPLANGVRAGLVFGDIGEIFAVERTSFSRREGFTGDFEKYLVHGPSGIIWTSTDDRFGRLRAVRQNGLISGYYLDTSTNAWQFIGSSSITMDDLRFHVALWSGDSAFEQKRVRAAFDDVIVNAGTLVGPECPFASSMAPENKTPVVDASAGSAAEH